MLIQSHNGVIKLLPALPKAWNTGEVKGLCARGGFVVDMKWVDGKLTDATVTSKFGGTAKIDYAGKVMNITVTAGQPSKVVL